jgi:enamine deaminase RidA (YjgF/YER057c/UK114 family)
MVAPAGELVIVAGQTGVDAAGRPVGDAAAQTRQALANVGAVLAAAGCGWRDVVRLQTFLTRAEDVPAFMDARRAVFAEHFPDGGYPPNTLVIVSRLVQPELLVEIEAMAVRPGARRQRLGPAASRPRRASRGARRRTRR